MFAPVAVVGLEAGRRVAPGDRRSWEGTEVRAAAASPSAETAWAAMASAVAASAVTACAEAAYVGTASAAKPSAAGM